MKQIQTLPVRPKIPSIASQLLDMSIGETARMELIGRSLHHYQETRSRMRMRGRGDWTHEFTEDGRALLITRIK